MRTWKLCRMYTSPPTSQCSPRAVSNVNANQHRQYFPPDDRFLDPSKITEKSISHASMAVAASMPSPPTTDPSTADQPAAKKAKLGPQAQVPGEDDDEWEQVKYPEHADVNGYPPEEEPQRSTSMDEDVMSGERKEMQTAALHTAQVGGDPPRSELEKDW